MEIGDPARKGREVPVVLDGITDTATGTVITPAEMAKRLDGTGILFIGENHTNQDFHDVQFRTIKALHEAGREVHDRARDVPLPRAAGARQLERRAATRRTASSSSAAGMTTGAITGITTATSSCTPRSNGINMYAVNSPRDVVKSVRTKGFENLTPEEAAHLPPKLAPENDEHRSLYRASFDKDDALHMNEQALDGLYRAQTMWDATMGWNALQALKAHGGPKAIMVVLIGAGHVTYGLGAERQIAALVQGPDRLAGAR